VKSNLAVVASQAKNPVSSVKPAAMNGASTDHVKTAKQPAGVYGGEMPSDKCGRKGRRGMEKQKDFLTFEGNIYTVFSHRVERTVLGTVWRFIMDDRTLVLTPFQTPKNAPLNPGMVPRSIESALSNLEILVYDVLDVYYPQEGSKEYDGIFKPGWFEKFSKYAADKFTKKDGAAEKAAFELIQTSNVRWGGKGLSIANLKQLRDMLYNVARQDAKYLTCTHGNLQHALFMWKEITEQDPTESILLAYGKGMPRHIDELAKQTAEVEGMTNDQARQLIMKRVGYVAEFGVGVYEYGQREVNVLLEGATLTVCNKEDEEEYRRVAPTEAEKETIEIEKRKLQLKKLSDHKTVLSSDQDGPMNRKQTAAFIHKCQSTLTNLMHDKVVRFHKKGNNVWFFRNEIIEDMKKYGWQNTKPAKK